MFEEKDGIEKIETTEEIEKIFEEPTVKAANNTKTVGIIAAAVVVIAIIIALAMFSGNRHAIVGTWEADVITGAERAQFNRNGTGNVVQTGANGEETSSRNFNWSIDVRRSEISGADGENAYEEWLYIEFILDEETLEMINQELEEMREMYLEFGLFSEEEVDEMIEELREETIEAITSTSTNITLETNADGEEFLTMFRVEYSRVR